MKYSRVKKISEKVIFFIFNQIFHSIKHLHSNSIFHRDLKLENILLTKDVDNNVKIKIIDFGFSIWMVDVYKEKLFCGTNVYMAPELLLKKPYLPGPTDIWALGVVLYVFLYRKFPFKAQTKHEIFRKIKKGASFPPSISPNAISLL